MAHKFRTPLAAMNEQQKEWLATAITIMVLADGSVTREEVETMLQSISFVKNEAYVENLKKFIHFQTLPTLPAFVGWDKQVKNKACMMLDLLDVCIADKDISPKEREQLIHIGKLLGFPPQKVEELIGFGQKAIDNMSDTP